MARGIIKQIFSEHWDEFLNRFGHRVRAVVIKEIRKILGCGSFANGYAEYQCEKCGEKKKVAFRCRSRFCGSCGKVYIDNRAENMAEKLIQCKHRHMVFTIAEELREYFMKDRKLLELLPQCAAEVIKSWWREQNKKENYTPGIVTVIHGIYAQSPKERPRLIKMINDKIKEMRRRLRNWRARIMKSFGYDPLECEKCGGKMKVIDIFYKKYGSVMEIYRKREMAKIEREMEEIRSMDKILREKTGGRIEPIYV